MTEIQVDMNKQGYMSSCISLIDEGLKRYKVDQKIIRKTELLCEEAILKMAKNATQEALLHLRVKRSFSGVAVEIRSKGEEIEELAEGGNITYAAQVLDNAEDEIDTGLLILKANEEMVKYSHNDGTNMIR